MQKRALTRSPGLCAAAGATLLVCALFRPAALAGEGQAPAAIAQARLDELWESPSDLASRDLFNGPWGAERAPDPDATYVFLEPKKGGINPGMTVRDPQGRKWKVKQPPLTGRGAEGPIEVVLSRVLSALGYHQPPVYFLPSFTLQEPERMRLAPGGRFRLVDPSLHDDGEWSWTRNPFAGTRPLRGLLVILLMFNSSDLKDSNNTLYEHTAPSGRKKHWYVVRDLGTALGSTGKVTPIRGNPDVFEKLGFITGIKHGYVEFAYTGRHQNLVDGTITPADVRWASELMSGLTREQWRDAFRAGRYDTAVSDRFINRLLAKIQEGLALGTVNTR